MITIDQTKQINTYSLLIEYDYIVVYHKERHVWRVLGSDTKTNWTRNLSSYKKTQKPTMFEYNRNTIHAYIKDVPKFKYEIFGMNEDELNIKKFIDLKIKYSEDFI